MVNKSERPALEKHSEVNKIKVIVPEKTDLNSPPSYPHQELLKRLLDKIKKVDFVLHTGVESSAKLTNRHYHICVVEEVMRLAIENEWGITRANDFIYIFNGKYWSEIKKEEMRDFLGKAAELMGVEKYKSRWYQFQEHLFKQFLCSAYFQTPQSNKNLVLINLRNGTFEIAGNKKTLREFRRDDFLTYQLPFGFDTKTETPIFKTFLNKVVPDKGLQNILAEYIAYVFVKGLKLEKCLLILGPGANGKSVFFEIINAMLGNHNVSNFSLANLSEEHNRALIANKLLNYGSEINGIIERDTLKNLISGEPVQARLKYGQSFIMTDYARLCYNCNELPKDVEHNEAWFRRFLIVPFDVIIPEQERDPDLAKKIINRELSGVFNWVLEGLDRLLSQKGFTKSEKVKSAIQKYKIESDSVYLFLEDEGFLKSTDTSVLIKSVYPEYRSFCISDGYKPLNKTNFIKRLKTLGFLVERKNIGFVVFINKSLQ